MLVLRRCESSVSRASRNPVTLVQNHVDALVPSGKVLILIYQVPQRGLKAVGPLVTLIQACMLS